MINHNLKEMGFTHIRTYCSGLFDILIRSSTCKFKHRLIIRVNHFIMPPASMICLIKCKDS